MANSLFLEVVAPDRSVFKGEATRFRAPGSSGSFEVLYNHAPLLATTDIGPVYITLSSGERVVLATSGGFVEVLNNRVIMIVESAEPASEIDVDRAKEAEGRAKAELEKVDADSRPELERALARARNRLRVAMGTVGSGPRQ